jgi:hypothetical protein
VDCYKCKFRGSVVGSAHSSCKILKQISDKEKTEQLEFMLAMGQVTLTNGENEPLVKLNPHGVKNGWAIWPINFDPVWIESCVFFKNKEETVNENTNGI